MCGIAATARGSGGQVGWLFSAFAGHPPGIVAPVHARAAIHTTTPLRGNREACLTTLGAAAPIDP
jgi:hypothetical protein